MSTAARTRRSRPERDLETDDLERRRALGQFFTPPDVTNFMWDMTEVLRKRRWHGSDTVIDPACGDGAFLRVAIERGQRRKCCYGLDIDQTLVPGWRRDADLRGAQLFHENGLENHPDHGIVPGGFELVIGNPPFAGRGLKDLLDLLPSSSKGGKQAPSLFGGESFEAVADQPGVPRERLTAASGKEGLDRLVRQLARYQCWRLCEESEDDDAQAGSLFAGAGLSARRTARSAAYERMAKAVLSTPADRTLNGALPEVRDAIRRMASTSVEVFFTERFVQLARPGGMIAVIVPESILASDQLGPLRLWLMQQVQLLAVVSLPHKVFSGVGANAKTGIIFARRFTAAEQRANSKAKEISPGLRITKETLKKRVLMVAPKDVITDSARLDYLSGVLSSANTRQRDGTL